MMVIGNPRFMRSRWAWWALFLLSAMPSLWLLSLYFFNPRALGIDATERLLQESGEWALRLLLITLACSPLKRIGIKWPLRYRRMFGLFAFYYATLHLSTYLFGWIELDMATFIDDLTKRPFIYLGMMTWIILLVLAATSPKWVVKALKQRWVILHKAVYLAIGLAWVHLWMQSRASAADALLYLAIIVVLLGERLLRSRWFKIAS
ncbi:sulfite oxidase heme-binding subunit YedZ [Reinekea blandensis]|uniref:Protein-methionine-sulfoxide reductase heme-binding subunit MsrQ n=1 Tax=Reinekea blandensis MED297 TaxID=314283 RepID=A4BJI4_9GAMM|nr:protein-methionine-sulfoxide reductase heme-binding subunit MsrQ [Reinekea blandensis]EAR07688.1 predicted membrane protein [Reinekea sp. MED297] [Reinekea blandensis MED297]